MGESRSSADTPDSATKGLGSLETTGAADTSVLQSLPPNPGFLPKPSADGSDSLASNEAQLFANGKDLAAEAQTNEHNRHQHFRNCLHISATVIFVVVMAIIIWGVGTYAWHLLMPEKLHYLTEKQLDTVSRLLATALFSSALTGYINKRMT